MAQNATTGRGVWKRSWVLRGGAAGIGLMISGCDTLDLKTYTVTSREKAAGVTLSAFATPWADIAGLMQPNFTMTGDTAAAQFVPITQQLQEQTLEAFSASLGVSGLVGPFKKPSGAAANTEPSSLPAATPPSGYPAGTSLPAAPSGFTPGLDPMLKYQAGNALLQFVQLLNSEMASVELDGTKAYVARIRLTVQPFRPNLPYDLYARISIVQNRDEAPPKNCHVRILPLLAADDVERAYKTTVAETARQLSAALNVVAPFGSLSSSANQVKAALNSLAGQDFDSRLTIGRQADTILSVRIGAALQGTSRRAIIGQNYNIATIFLVPKECNDPKGVPLGAFRLVAYTEFRNAETGEVLPNQSRAEYLRAGQDEINSIMDPVGDDLNPALPKFARKSQSEKYKFIRSLIRCIQTNDFAGFSEILGEVLEDKGEAKIVAGSFWVRLSGLLSVREYQSAAMDVAPPALPATFQDSVTLIDDGKSAMTAQVFTSSHSPNPYLRARLSLNVSGRGPIAIPASSVGINAATGVLTLQFPSLAKMNLVPASGGPSGGGKAELIDLAGSHLEIGMPDDDAKRKVLGLSYVVQPADPDPGFSVSSGAKQIVAIQGVGSLTVSVGKFGAEESASISVDGGQITSAAGGSIAADGTIKVPAGGGVAVQIGLANLVQNQPVTVTVEGRKPGVAAGSMVSAGKKSVSVAVIEESHK